MILYFSSQLPQHTRTTHARVHTHTHLLSPSSQSSFLHPEAALKNAALNGSFERAVRKHYSSAGKEASAGQGHAKWQIYGGKRTKSITRVRERNKRLN